MEVRFRCPMCRDDKLEEVMGEVTTATVIKSVDREDEEITEYLGSTYEGGGVVSRYQCTNCGWTVKNEHGEAVDNPTDLIPFLLGKGWPKGK